MGVFETLRVINGQALFFEEHRAELTRAMAALGLTCDKDLAEEAENLPTASGRWRWVVRPRETRTVFTEEDLTGRKPVALSLSSVRVGSNNWDARFKTVSHLSHAQAWKLAVTPEVVLLNERGHVASASRGNIFWRRGDHVYTPAHEAGCRRGVVRAFVLPIFNVEEGHFPVAEVLEADEIFVTNSMRGIVSVNEVPGRALKAFAIADHLREKYEKAIAAQL